MFGVGRETGKPCFVVFADFRDINIPSVADFELPT